MKCNPWRWFWGLVPVLMLGWIAILGERERIEADLTSRVRTVLERQGLGWANVTFEGRDAVLRGRATDPTEPGRAAAAVVDTLGVRVVTNEARVLTVVENYEWNAVRKGSAVRVSGFVPTEQAKRDIAAMFKASMPGLEVEDRTELARGSPPLEAWLGGVGFGVKQLALLKEGRVDLQKADFSIDGEAIDARSYALVRTALGGRMPQGIRLKSDTVRPPLASPYVWSARRQGKEIVLGGHVPSEPVGKDLMAAARRIAADAKIVDRMEPASGAPDGFSSAANALILALGKLEEGTAELRDRTSRLDGTAESESRADEIKREVVASALRAFPTSGEIRHREPTIRTISPYVTAVALSGDAVIVSGYAPTTEDRTAVMALATSAFRGRAVRNELQIGAGQHDGWSSCLETAIDALRRLKTGRAELTGRSLRVSGVTDSDQIVATLPDDVRRRAGSSCDAEVNVALDPAAIALAQASAADAERKAAEETRRRAEAERQIADAQRTEAERAAAEARRRDEDARRLADEQKRRDEQIARERQEAERQRAEAEQRRRDQERQKQAAVDTPRVTERPRTGNPVVDACQDALSKVTREGTINFKRASFDLDPDSFTTLNRLAIAANDCPDLIVEIEGHTDSEGTPERNQRLSNRRADAVKDYLVKAGVSVSRLIAIGYGQSRNIAPNDTAEGRARNRRIEFVVKMRGDR